MLQRCGWVTMLGLLWASLASAQGLTTISWNPANDHFSLHDLSLVTGAASNERTSGQTGFMIGLAYRPQDNLVYGLSANGGTFGNQLVRIDPLTGVATTVGPHGLSNVFEGGLAVDPTTGVLYGLGNFLPNDDIELFTLDITTGAATVVGPLTGLTNSPTFNDPSALAFDAAGQLYVLDGFNGRSPSPNADLYYVDKATANVTSTVTLDRKLSVAFGMAFHPLTGQLYLADSNFTADGFTGTNSLYLLDPVTGATTLVGVTGITSILTDMTFVAAIPEPTSLALLSLGASGLVGWKRRRRKKAAATPATPPQQRRTNRPTASAPLRKERVRRKVKVRVAVRLPRVA